MKKVLLVLFVALAVLGMTGPAMASGNEDITNVVKEEGANAIISEISQYAENSGDATSGNAPGSSTLGGAAVNIVGDGNKYNDATVQGNNPTLYRRWGDSSEADVDVGNWAYVEQNDNLQLLIQDVINEIIASTAIYPPNSTGDITIDNNITMSGANVIKSVVEQEAINNGSATSGDATATNLIGGATVNITGNNNTDNDALVYGNSPTLKPSTEAEVDVYNGAEVYQNDNKQKLFQEIDNELLAITGDTLLDVLVDIEVFKDINMNVTKNLDIDVNFTEKEIEIEKHWG